MADGCSVLSSAFFIACFLLSTLPFPIIYRHSCLDRYGTSLLSGDADLATTIAKNELYFERRGDIQRSKKQCFGRSYFGSRVLHTTNGPSSFQLKRALKSGDIQPNPGPESTPKYPRKECKKNVRSNQNAILCAVCMTWSHVKCLVMSKVSFRYYLENPNLDWICSLFFKVYVPYTLKPPTPSRLTPSSRARNCKSSRQRHDAK